MYGGQPAGPFGGQGAASPFQGGGANPAFGTNPPFGGQGGQGFGGTTAPAYGANPAQTFGQPYGAAPTGGFGAPNTGFGAPNTGFGAPNTGFGAPTTGFGAPNTGFGAPNTGYGGQASPFGAPSTAFGGASMGATAGFGTGFPSTTGATGTFGAGAGLGGTFGATGGIYGAQPSQAYGGPQAGYPYGQQPGLGFMPIPDYSGWRQMRVGSLPPDIQSGMFQLQSALDQNEHALSTTKHNLEALASLQDTIKDKARQLFSKAKLVIAKQQRLARAVELRRSFEIDISNFMNEFLKLMEFCSTPNVSTKVSTPASFLAELIRRIEERVRALETSILELEDLLQAEVTGDSNAVMIVQTLRLFQEKFETVTALVAEAHGRVTAWQARYIDIMRDHYRTDVRDMFRDRPDELQLFTAKAEGLELPIAGAGPQASTIQATLAMRDAIVGRVGVLSTPNMRAAQLRK